MEPVTIGLLLALGVVILLLLFIAMRTSKPSADANAVQRIAEQTAVISERLSHMDGVVTSVNTLSVELRGLSERVLKVEQNQSNASQSIVALGTGLTETGTVAKGIANATAAIRDELVRAKNDLTELQAQAKARLTLEEQTADSIKRLEAIIAGTQTKGAAGENIVEVVFAKLPAEWQVRNMRVGDKAVEFGLRLPNNLVLPIDSKWAATNLLEQFIASDDPDEQIKLKSQIENAVIGRMKEVRKYIDPHLTVNFAIATVPDAIYDLCSGIHSQIFEMNVVLISYSMLVPYLLLVFQTVLRSGHSIDLQRLDAYLQSAQSSIKSAQNELDGRFSRALTMLGNSRDDMAGYLAKAAGGLTSLQMSTSDHLPPLESGVEEAEGTLMLDE